MGVSAGSLYEKGGNTTEPSGIPHKPRKNNIVCIQLFHSRSKKHTNTHKSDYETIRTYFTANIIQGDRQNHKSHF